MSVRIIRTKNEKRVRELHSIMFPKDEWDTINNHSAMWVASDVETRKDVGFCIVRRLTKEIKVVFMQRVGVLKNARGLGLQRRMIRVRLNWAKRHGIRKAITYTVYSNYESIVNLLRCGFKFYDPDFKWAGDVHYFIKAL